MGALLRGALGMSHDGAISTLVFEQRWDRMVVGAVVGVALAVAGVALQTLLRNPLAEPFLLGLSTAAALGWWCSG